MVKGRVEKNAIEVVMKYEKVRCGKIPEDVSEKRLGYDVESKGRCIEVKGQNTKNPRFIHISKNIISQLGKNISNYYIYVVYNIREGEKPKMKILEPDTIFKHLEIDPLFLLKGNIIKQYGEDAWI